MFVHQPSGSCESSQADGTRLRLFLASHLQDGELVSTTSGKYKGTLQTLETIGRHEGLKGLQAGLPIAVIRYAGFFPSFFVFVPRI
jgi:hypothetical protein